MLPLLHDTWGALMLRGILAVLFGAIAIILPGPALFGVAVLFGAYALVDGLFVIISLSRKVRKLPSSTPTGTATACASWDLSPRRA